MCVGCFIFDFPIVNSHSGSNEIRLCFFLFSREIVHCVDEHPSLTMRAVYESSGVFDV